MLNDLKSETLLIKIPTYQFHCNLVICPLPKGEKKEVTHYELRKYLKSSFAAIIQGESYIFMLSNNGCKKLLTGQLQTVEFLPNCMYCYFPSYCKDVGFVRKFDFIPEFLTSFRFLEEIKEKVNTNQIIKE